MTGGLQSATGFGITKCDRTGLQSAMGFGLQSVTNWVTKCDRDYKVRRAGLQSVTGITKCNGITKCDGT